MKSLNGAYNESVHKWNGRIMFLVDISEKKNENQTIYDCEDKTKE